MADDLRSVWQGSFHLFGVEVKCHVLSNGQRIIEEESLINLLEAMGAPGKTINQSEIDGFARWQQGR